MASLVLSGDTSGSVTLAAPAVAGSNTQTLAAVTGTLAPIVSGTAVTASSTSVDFTSIPSWVKRITVMLNGISLSGSSSLRFRLGTGGTVATSGYLGTGSNPNGSPPTQSFTAGFDMYGGLTAANAGYGSIVFALLGSNAWIANGTIGTSLPSLNSIAGSVTLGGALDIVRITTINGTDTFDAGTINILYE